MLNKKALYCFLGLTFGLTILLVIIARMIGFTLYDAPSFLSQMVVLAAMFVPALSAIVTQKFVAHQPLKELGFKFGPKSMYLKTYVTLVLMYVLEYLIVWLFFLKPDFTLTSFLNQFNINVALPMSAGKMVLIFSFITFFVSPIVNMIPSLGEEIGWRGFLVPNLEPLGKAKACVLSGLIWGLWHTPMILFLGFLYGQQFIFGSIFHLLMVTGIGIWFAYIWFETRSTVQAAFMHAVFNANAYGIWAMIFVSDNKLLIGAGGAINVILCLLLGVWSLKKIKNK
ncbi:MAG: CPBP family intramembrane metalloprotease [Patescibacteria group bacterium]|nr:CPBP family intramembrane metalloprotease [Patescibacteria group bacterium]